MWKKITTLKKNSTNLWNEIQITPQKVWSA
nr:MAG TPA: hypothetical protein [Caudoviricetes sp.]